MVRDGAALGAFDVSNMRLKLIRTGGVAGLAPPPVVVDTAALPEKEAQRVLALVAEARFFHLPAVVRSRKPQTDRFQYSLEIKRKGRRRHAVRCDEEAASGALCRLLHAVQTLKNLS